METIHVSLIQYRYSSPGSADPVGRAQGVRVHHTLLGIPRLVVTGNRDRGVVTVVEEAKTNAVYNTQ